MPDGKNRGFYESKTFRSNTFPSQNLFGILSNVTEFLRFAAILRFVTFKLIIILLLFNIAYHRVYAIGFDILF